MDEDVVPKAVITSRPPFLIHHFESVGSTNDYLKAYADAPEFTVIVADQQTAGRGRRERTWHSAAGEGLYFSVLLRPSYRMESIQLISLLSGIAVAEALLEIGVGGVDIKWPNDVLIAVRKVCGILAEGASSGTADSRLIVGIGINLNHESFPSELSATATSVLLATGEKTEPMAFLDRVLMRMSAWYEVLATGGGQRIVTRWEELSSFAYGQRVYVTTDEESLSGTTSGVSSTGGLNVREDSGRIRTVLAGEVTRIRKNEE